MSRRTFRGLLNGTAWTKKIGMEVVNKISLCWLFGGMMYNQFQLMLLMLVDKYAAQCGVWSMSQKFYLAISHDSLMFLFLNVLFFQGEVIAWRVFLLMEGGLACLPCFGKRTKFTFQLYKNFQFFPLPLFEAIRTLSLANHFVFALNFLQRSKMVWVDSSCRNTWAKEVQPSTFEYGFIDYPLLYFTLELP